jgi:myo-inositol-1(or 4)-monophosphatase
MLKNLFLSSNLQICNKYKPALSRINNLATRCRDIRRFAAPTIDIFYVASGLLDAHTESLKYWDVAAAGLIAREAGAYWTRWKSAR